MSILLLYFRYRLVIKKTDSDWMWNAVISGPEAFRLADGILLHPNETDTNQCDTIAALCKDNLLWMEVLWLHIIIHERSNPWLSGTIRACTSTLFATTNCCAMWTIMACLRLKGNFVCGNARQWQGCCSGCGLLLSFYLAVHSCRLFSLLW